MLPVVKAKINGRHVTNVLIDSGSSNSFMSAKLVDSLNLRGTKKMLNMSTMNTVTRKRTFMYNYYSNNSKQNYVLYSNLPPADKSSQTETVLTNTTAKQSDQAPLFTAGRFANDPQGIHFYTGLETMNLIIFMVITIPSLWRISFS